MSESARSSFWKRTRRVTLGLLMVWMAVNLLLPWFARDLNAYTLFGLPAGYWLVAEGALLMYLGIIVAYAVVMARLEGQLLRSQERDDSTADSPGAGAV